MPQSWCESSRSDIHCPERIGISSETRYGIPQRPNQPHIPSIWDTCTNVVLVRDFVHAPIPETGSARLGTLSLDDRVERITASLLTRELAQYAREPERYRKMIHDLIRNSNPRVFDHVPDSEMKKRIQHVLIFEMMRDLFIDLSDEEIDAAREAGRSGDFFQ